MDGARVDARRIQQLLVDENDDFGRTTADAAEYMDTEYPDGGIPAEKVAPFTGKLQTTYASAPGLLIQEAMQRAKAKTGKQTHTSMVGGKFGVLAGHPDRREGILREFASALKDGSILFAVEKLISFDESGVTKYVLDVDKLKLPIEERIGLACLLSKNIAQLLKDSDNVVEDSRVYVSVPHLVMANKGDGELVPFLSPHQKALYYPLSHGNLHLHGPAMTKPQKDAVSENLFLQALSMPDEFPMLNEQVLKLTADREAKPTATEALATVLSERICDSAIVAMRLPGACKKVGLSFSNKAYMCICSVHTDASGETVVERGAECVSHMTRRPDESRGWSALLRVLSCQVDAGTESVMNERAMAMLTGACQKKVRNALARSSPAANQVFKQRKALNTESEVYMEGLSAAFALKDKPGDKGTLEGVANRLRGRANNLKSFMAEVTAMYNNVLTFSGLSTVETIPIQSVRTFPKNNDICILTLVSYATKACGHEDPRSHKPMIHKSNNQYLTVDLKKGTVHLKCHDDMCKQKDYRCGAPTRCSVKLSPDALHEMVFFLPRQPVTKRHAVLEKQFADELLVKAKKRKGPASDEEKAYVKKRMALFSHGFCY